MNNPTFRGSEWRKWDLHVHSPASFGGDYAEYIRNIDLSEADVIGINDYCTIQGYLKVVSGSYGVPQKTLFPVIEFRTNNMMLDKGDPRLQAGVRINFHIIFDNDPALIPRITTWLNALDCIGEGGVPDKLGNVDDKGERQNLSFNYLAVINSLKTDSALREGALVWLPYDEYGGIDKIDPQTDGYFKLGLINEAHIIGSSRRKQIDFFLWRDPRHEPDTIKEWLHGRRLPCIKGSDAHKINYPFGRLQDSDSQPVAKFCWIKAEPTFEGLKQILYEPEGRVLIGESNPSSFGHSVIDSFSVSPNDESLFLRSIGGLSLNPGLNCVVGSRGSGKSTLLDSIALTLGQKSVLEASRNNYVGHFFNKHDAGVLSAQVRHSSTESSTTLSPRLPGPTGFIFDYYHQKNIGELADPRNEEELSRFLFRKIFRSDPSLVDVFGTLDQGQARCRSSLAINREQVVACEQEIKKEEEITRSIGEKKMRVTFLSKKAVEPLVEERSRVIILQQKMARIRARLASVDEVPLVRDADTVDRTFFEQLVLSALDPEGKLLPAGWAELERDARAFLDALESDKGTLESKVTVLTDRLRRLGSAAEFDKQLEDIWVKIKSEADKLSLPISREDLNTLDAIHREIADLDANLVKIRLRKEEKAALLKERQGVLTEYTRSLASLKEKMESSFQRLLQGTGVILRETVGLEFSTVLTSLQCLECIRARVRHGPDTDSPSFPNRRALLDLFESLLHSGVVEAFRQGDFSDWDVHGLGEGSRKYFRDVQNKEEVAMHLEEILPELTSRLLWRADSSRPFKHLRNCSIGERGTALLSIILVAGNEPLVIDQPEDDLDHYYLYTTLIPIIKEAKTRRQLIFATHDANIVINADAELIVVVQTLDGASCSIEQTTIEDLSARDRILEILEGGRDAFRHRQQKYGIATA